MSTPGAVNVTLAELFADARAAERDMDLHRRGEAGRALSRLENGFTSALTPRVWDALERAGYLVEGVPASVQWSSGIGPHAWLRLKEGNKGRQGVHAVNNRDGQWYVALESDTESSSKNNVPTSQLANVVLLMVERLERCRNAAPRGAASVDTVA